MASPHSHCVPWLRVPVHDSKVVGQSLLAKQDKEATTNQQKIFRRRITPFCKPGRRESFHLSRPEFRQGRTFTRKYGCTSTTGPPLISSVTERYHPSRKVIELIVYRFLVHEVAFERDLILLGHTTGLTMMRELLDAYTAED